MSTLWLIALWMTAEAGQAPSAGDFAAYRKQNSLNCIGPFESQAQPATVTLGHKNMFSLAASSRLARTVAMPMTKSVSAWCHLPKTSCRIPNAIWTG